MKLTKEDKQFLLTYKVSDYERPSITVDMLIFTVIENTLKLLLIKRKNPPYKDGWALPGGFLDLTKKENLDEAARRELKEETNVDNGYLEQFGVFSNVDRDPRTRVVSVGYLALVPFDEFINSIEAGDDAKDAKLFDIILKEPMKPFIKTFHNISTGQYLTEENIAFDHLEIIEKGLDALQKQLIYNTSDIAFKLVNKEFTLDEIQKVYETILNKKLSSSNFRKQLIKRFNLFPTGEFKRKYQRPARLYTKI